jgi:hypothetical protein
VTGNPTGKILTGVGLIKNGKLTPEAKKTFVLDVIALLTTGNHDGKSPALAPFCELVPIVPAPGPQFANPTTLSMEQMFWFDPDPLAALMSTILLDSTKCPMYYQIIVDLLYGSTMEALDLNGATPLAPIFDVTCAFDLDPPVPFPFPLPDLAIKTGILPPPKLLLKLTDLGIIPPTIPLPPIPPIPPSLPDFSLGLAPPGLAIDAAITIPELLLGLIKLPFDLIIKLIAPPDLGLILNLIAFDFSAVFKLMIDLLLQIPPFPFVPILPKMLIASILVYLKNVMAAVVVDIVGMIIGANGAITKALATATGLIVAS